MSRDQWWAYIARYARLFDEPDADSSEREDLVTLTAEVLEGLGVSVNVSVGGILSGSPTLAVVFPFADYRVEFADLGRSLTLEDVEIVRQQAASQPQVRTVLLSVDGYAQDPTAAAGTSVTLLAKEHLDAIVFGLLSPSELFDFASRRSRLDGQPLTPLSEMLAPASPMAALSVAGSDFLPSDRDLVSESSPGVRWRHLLSGYGMWPEVLGAVCADDDRLLVSTASGLVEVNVRRKTTEWTLPARGLRAAPVLSANGAILALCNDAVILVRDGEVLPIAGGFPNAVCLIADGDGHPWVLSGPGTDDGAGTSTHALTRISIGPGQQMTYSIVFDAAVKSAAWLIERAFYLSASGHSAIVDLNKNGAIDSSSWIESPQPYPQYAVALGHGAVLSGSATGDGVSALLHRIDTSTRASSPIARLAINKLQGMTMAPNGAIHLVGDVRGNDAQISQPVFIRLTMPEDLGPKSGPPSSPQADVLQQVRIAATGRRQDYALDPRPHGRGGLGEVIGARHKATDARVAFKRLNLKTQDNVARMRREIEAGQLFGNDSHVVPVLDFSPAGDWFVMPFAEETADEVSEELAHADSLLELVKSVCIGLRRPHQLGWIHRDLKPENILRLNGMWAVADWGLVRRPRGQTSHPGRTPIGHSFGSDGWAAPELSNDAHVAGPQADIYSIGQIIGWALTGQRPMANRPLLPSEGPWRTIVEAATHDDPRARPKNVAELLGLIETSLYRPGISESSPQVLSEPAVPSEPGSRLHTPTAHELDSRAAEAATQASTIIVVKGILGYIRFDGWHVTIKKAGFGQHMQGQIAVPLEQITGVHVKPATRLFHGYIQIRVAGSYVAPELKGLFQGGRPHIEDPYSMSFSHKRNADIATLKHHIDTAIDYLRSGSQGPPLASGPRSTSVQGVLDSQSVSLLTNNDPLANTSAARDAREALAYAIRPRLIARWFATGPVNGVPHASISVENRGPHSASDIELEVLTCTGHRQTERWPILEGTHKTLGTKDYGPSRQMLVPLPERHDQTSGVEQITLRYRDERGLAEWEYALKITHEFSSDGKISGFSWGPEASERRVS